jgi:hypothetical protein
MAKKDVDIDPELRFPSKKCPECYEYMPLKVEKCPFCGTRVGRIDKYGHASRLFDWKGYGTAAVAILAFILYLVWAFGDSG